MSLRGFFKTSFAACCAAILTLAPFAVNQFCADPIFDGALGDSLGALPVQRAGRTMPLSSAAADILKSFSGKISAKVDGKRVSASKWLWLVCADFDKLSQQPFLRTDNRDLQKFLGAQGRCVSYAAVEKNYDALAASAQSEDGGKYADACADLLQGAFAFASAAQSVGVNFPNAETFSGGLENWQSAVNAAAVELAEAKKQNRSPHDEKLLAAHETLSFLRSLAAFDSQNTTAVLRSVAGKDGFFTPAQALLARPPDAISTRELAEFAAAADALKIGNLPALERAADGIFAAVRGAEDIDFTRVRIENFVNFIDPFFAGLLLYGASIVFFVFALLRQKGCSTFGTVFLGVAAVVHIAAIIARVYIQQRPPVTNFYSSVVFTGAIIAAVGWTIYLRRGTVSAAVSAALGGLLSLLVAVNMPYSGDTMGMMRAVLNSNFWLSTHVMTIMLGYCGVFLAGFMASVRLVSNAFSRGNFGAETAKTANTVYAILCISLVFTFMGTMLGGIWADMSWGRFWGWDPKENGALMIVLWIAATMHCRLLRVVNDRFFLALSALGNIVVAWAWFGVNLLGVGLHSYGFIDGGWFWFLIFIFLQILVAPFAFLVYKDGTM